MDVVNKVFHLWGTHLRLFNGLEPMLSVWLNMKNNNETIIFPPTVLKRGHLFLVFKIVSPLWLKKVKYDKRFESVQREFIYLCILLNFIYPLFLKEQNTVFLERITCITVHSTSSDRFMLTQTGVSHNETQMSISDKYKYWINMKTSCSHCLSHINSDSVSAFPKSPI